MILSFRVRDPGEPGKRPLIARSECGRYQITELMGRSTHYRWVAYDLVSDERIGFFRDKATAKEACNGRAAEEALP